MTTIAWDGTSIAADRRLSNGVTNGKIFRLKSGEVVAGAGFYDQIVEIVRWMEQGGRQNRRPVVPDKDAESSDIFVLDVKGQMHWLTWPYLRRVPILERFAASGSGAAYALGAMAAGASARRAVEIASCFDGNTGDGVDVFTFEK